MEALKITGKAAEQLWPLSSNFYVAHPSPFAEEAVVTGIGAFQFFPLPTPVRTMVIHFFK